MESSAVMGEAEETICKENTNSEDGVCVNGNVSSDDEGMEITSDISKAPVKSHEPETIENHKKVPVDEVPMEVSDNGEDDGDDEPEAEADDEGEPEIMEVEDIDDDEDEEEEEEIEKEEDEDSNHDTEKKTLTNGNDNSLNDDDDDEDDDDDVVIENPEDPLNDTSDKEKSTDKCVELNDSGDVVLVEDNERKENGDSCKSPDVQEVIDISDKDSEVMSLITPKKKANRKSTESFSGPPRRSSRNLHKQKSYIEKEEELEESDIEEILPEDPLADPLRDDKENNKKTKTPAHSGSTIVVSDTKRLVEIAANSKSSNSTGKKEPTLVIIDTNSILSGRGAVPVSQKSTSFSMMPVALPAQGVYPPNMRATITPIPMATSTPVQPKPTPPPTPILPTLTDDMFVVEAPSFIVPYVYEKPPMKPFKEFVEQIAKEIEENKKKKEQEEKKDEEVKKEAEEKETKEEKSGDGSDDERSNSSEKDKDKEKTNNEKDDTEEKDESEKKKDESEKKKDESSSEDVKTINLDDIPDETPKPKSNSYFDNALGQFFVNIGFNLVQEFVQTDLLKQQKRKNSREGNTSLDTKLAISSLIKNLEYSKENNEPFRLEQKKCEFCSFKTESNLVLAHHLETPHMRNYVYKCNFCPLEVRSPHDILFHMEAEHNTRGRLERAPAFHQCPNCAFEDNQKGKLSRHLVTCLKKFRPERNLEPPHDWEPPAKIPRVPRIKQTGLQATAATYQALAQSKSANAYNMFAKLQSQQNNAQAFARGRGRPSLMGKINSIRPSAPVIRPGANMLFRPGTSGGSVLVPASYQFGGNQVFQVMSGQSEVQGAGKLTTIGQSTPVALLSSLSSTNNTLTIQNSTTNKNSTGKVVQQPSISITPLPRQPTTTSSTKQTQSTTQSDSSSKATFVICEICDGYIKDLEQLRNHMQWIHKVKIHPKMIYNRPPLNCQKCQFRFFTDQGLERHLLGSHGLVTSSMQEAANKSKDAGRCPVCGRVYQWKLLNHVARDHNMTLKPAHLSYKCTVCTATFGMYKQFENHVYSAHSVVAKRVMEKKASSPANRTNDSLLKPLKINDEITIIPQPAKAKTNSASVSRNSDRNSSSDRGK